MFLRCIVFSLSLFIPIGVFAQTKIDSLHAKIIISRQNDHKSVLANYYGQLAYQYIIQGKYDSALYYYHRSIKADPVNMDVNLLASNYNGIGSVYNYLGVNDSSLYYYDRALTIYTTIRDTLTASYVETNMSMIYNDMAVFDKALEYAFRSAKRLESLEDWSVLADTYNTVSLLYVQINDYTKGLEYAYKTLELRKRAKAPSIGQSYNNIGEIFLNQGFYDSALAKFEIALQLKKKNNDRRTFSSTIANQGTTLFYKGRIAEAEAKFLEALTLKREFNDRVGEAAGYHNLARIALHVKNPAKAEDLLLKAEKILAEMNSPEFRKENLELLIQCSEMSKKFPLAVRYLHELLTLKDSILTKDKAQSLNAIQIRYETEKKEQQIVLLEEQAQLKSTELKAQRAMIYGLTGGVILLVVIGALIYTNFTTAKKGKANVEILLRELHHRVKNNLQLLSSVLSLQSQQLTDEHALVAVKSNESRVNAMALIHRKLYAGVKNRTINMHDYIKELTDFLLNSYGFGTNDLRIITDVEDVEVDVDKAIPLGLILNEVISNSLKYAFCDQSDPLIKLTLKTNESKELLAEVHDNGRGFEKEIDPGSEQSFGLKMIKLLTKELHGSIRIEGKEGTSVYIKIPLK